jgi:aspartate aminotransferase
MTLVRINLHPRIEALAPSATLGMKAKAKALADRGIAVVSLGAGEPNFETPPAIIDAAISALRRGVNHYTASRGTDELVKAICAKFKRDQHVHYEPAQVMATCGSKAAFSTAFDALLGEGDEAIIFSPYWVTYPELIRLAGATPVVVDCKAENGYLPTVENFRAALTHKTKLVVLNSPNNPTGVVWPERVLRQIMDELKGTSVCVLSDEIYEHIVFDDAKHVSPASFSDDAYERTIVICGASKGYAMTGWRVGYMGGPKDLIQGMLKLQEQRYTCITGVAQAAAAFALQENADVHADIERMRQAYQKRRDLALELLADVHQIRTVRPSGAFYLMMDLSALIGKMHRGAPVLNDIDLAERLLAEGHVATVPGTPFGAPGTLRISLASAEEEIKEGLTRIKQWLM